MPIYEYQCKECEHFLDELQKVAAVPLQDCPSCGKPSLKRLVSAPRFRLKGKGWYETDFKSKNQRNLAGDDGGKSSEKKSEPTAGKAADKKSPAGESKTDASKSAAGKSSA